ncbi:MAG: ArsB/NhaD family transporter [Dehalococcoidia bacterium]
MLKDVLALVIFTLSLLAVLTRPRGISEAVSSVAGAALMLLATIVPVSQAAHLLLDSWNVLLFFAGLVLVSWATEQSGFFRWIALWAGRLAGGDTRRLLLNVFGLGVLISTFLSNDATALLLTPVVVALTQEIDLPALPFALACTFIADTASVTLPVSNPINVLFLESFRGIHLGAYLQHLLLPSLAAITINIAVFLLLFRGKTGPSFRGAALTAPREAIKEPRFFRYTLVCLAILCPAYLAGSLLGWPLSLVALAGAAALVLGGIGFGALPAAQVRHSPWTIVPFIAGLLVLVQGLENAGVSAWLGTQLVNAAGHGRLPGVLATVFGSALGANLLNNVPMATVLASSIRGAHVRPLALRRGLIYAAIFGCDIGPNLTIVGSLSTILWLVLLRGRGVQVTSWQYIRTGLIVTPPMLLAGALLIVLLR